MCCRWSILAFIREVCDYGAARGVELWIEAHNEFATGRVLRGLLNRAGRPDCKVIYDIIHPYEHGEQPSDTVRLFDKACAHVHMKDGVPHDDPRYQDWKYTAIGEGELPIPDILHLLQTSGYEGYYSLEWEPKWRPELRALGLGVHDVLRQYPAYMRALLTRSNYR